MIKHGYIQYGVAHQETHPQPLYCARLAQCLPILHSSRRPRCICIYTSIASDMPVSMAVGLARMRTKAPNALESFGEIKSAHSAFIVFSGRSSHSIHGPCLGILLLPACL